MALFLPEPLPALVRRKFERAKANGSLQLSETELAIIRTRSGVPFQLRWCPALSKKPKHDDKTAKKPPFIDPPEDLFIANLPGDSPSHILVLNKFPVIAEHFILATKRDKPQTDVLEQDDVEAAYTCLKAWEEGGGRLFSFFNSGEHSGASQPHRHLQFLPVDMMRGGDRREEWDLLADLLPRGDVKLPFRYFCKSLPANAPPGELHSIYLALLSDAIAATGAKAASPITAGRSAPISYNLAMTTSSMVVAPRTSEGWTLRVHDRDIGFVSLNGTILGGTLMVKAEQEWDKLRSNAETLDDILDHIGLQSGTGQDQTRL